MIGQPTWSGSRHHSPTCCGHKKPRRSGILEFTDIDYLNTHVLQVESLEIEIHTVPAGVTIFTLIALELPGVGTLLPSSCS